MCHCLACQKRTGSVFGIQARWPSDRVTIEGHAQEYARIGDEGSATTFRLPTCGAIVYFDNDRPRTGSPHKARPELIARHPVHIVLRVISAVGNLRRRFTYQAIREATLTAARREDFRIVHLSIQRTQLHLLVEADNKDALASGMQGFQISAAKHLNAAISRGKPGPRRRGAVFPDRYRKCGLISSRAVPSAKQ